MVSIRRTYKSYIENKIIIYEEMFLLDGMSDVKLIVIFIYQINEESGVDLL